MSEAIISAIRLAFPDSRAKRVARAIGASFMTGRRIWGSGRVSALYRRQLIEVLDQELAQNALAIHRLRVALRGMGDEMVVHSPAADSADSVGTVREVEAGQAVRSTSPDAVKHIGARGR